MTERRATDMLKRERERGREWEEEEENFTKALDEGSEVVSIIAAV